MRYSILNFFVFIFTLILNSNTFAEMTLEKLFFDNSQPFHLKILEAIPENGKLQIGPENAENTIIEFMDYFCGYCKKIHPELMELAKKRDDTRVIFLQHPVLSESSKVIAEMVIAATYQNKGLEFHNELFLIQGSINQEKLEKVVNKVGLDILKLRIDITKDEVKNIVRLSSFLANGAGARGTPTIFVNDEFIPGYVSSQQIKSLLK